MNDLIKRNNVLDKGQNLFLSKFLSIISQMLFLDFSENDNEV